ncbi:uncharacterized protein BJ171DRAFT_599004 [Polychytrium aggregatum]|uniref:uncharacterized protein n=1 Tax=Polychytrium aggregatum TaxID=110093 RepID=UPI0022FEFF5D|nr:uncharacterized protein BJ171DRAFT_599004 [Polychytrium aggregatum]KAI9204574.1 hypothetical protein BJ171DRAFT_599004 [Polychytrium aggregatum]
MDSIVGIDMSPLPSTMLVTAAVLFALSIFTEVIIAKTYLHSPVHHQFANLYEQPLVPYAPPTPVHSPSAARKQPLPIKTHNAVPAKASSPLVRSPEPAPASVQSAAVPATSPIYYEVVEYHPPSGQEIELRVGDVVTLSKILDQAIAEGVDQTSGQSGFIPISKIQHYFPHTVVSAAA